MVKNQNQFSPFFRVNTKNFNPKATEKKGLRRFRTENNDAISSLPHFSFSPLICAVRGLSKPYFQSTRNVASFSFFALKFNPVFFFYIRNKFFW